MRFEELDLLAVGHTIQLVGAVYQGEGKTLLCMFPGEYGFVAADRPIPVEFVSQDGSTENTVDTLNMSSEEWQRFLRQVDLLETEVLQQAADGAVTKAFVRKTQRNIDQTVSWDVYRRDGYRCRYCGQNDVPLTVDHLVLWEEGGPSIPENLLACCRPCNRERGRQLYDEWLKSRYYARVSRRLSPDALRENEKMAGTLPHIPRVVNKRSR